VNAVSTNLRSPDRGLSKRRATVGTQADRRDVVRVCALVLALWVGGTARAADPPDCERHIDRSYDVVIRRTDLGLAGTIDPSLHRPVELLSITLGRWSPTDAQNDLFAGAFAPGGGFVRLDVELDGLRNPRASRIPQDSIPSSTVIIRSTASSRSTWTTTTRRAER
jgi:hypothetical protein